MIDGNCRDTSRLMQLKDSNNKHAISHEQIAIRNMLRPYDKNMVRGNSEKILSDKQSNRSAGSKRQSVQSQKHRHSKLEDAQVIKIVAENQLKMSRHNSASSRNRGSNKNSRRRSQRKP